LTVLLFSGNHDLPLDSLTWDKSFKRFERAFGKKITHQEAMEIFLKDKPFTYLFDEAVRFAALFFVLVALRFVCFFFPPGEN
jgi:hypothetical protein